MSRSLKRRFLPLCALALLALPGATRAQSTISFAFLNTKYVPLSFGRQLSFTMEPTYALGNGLSGATLVVNLPPGVSFVSADPSAFDSVTVVSITGGPATGEQVTLAIGLVNSNFLVFSNILTVSIDNTVADGAMLRATFDLSGTLTTTGARADSGPVPLQFQAGFLAVSVSAASYEASCRGEVKNADFSFSNFSNSSNDGTATSGNLQSSLSAGAIGGLPAIAQGATDRLVPTLPAANTPVKLGDIAGPSSEVRLTGIGADVLAYGGFALFLTVDTTKVPPVETFTASNLPADANCGAGVTLSFSNPNPFTVPLIVDERENVFLATGNQAATDLFGNGFGFPGTASTGLTIGNGNVTDIGFGGGTSTIFERFLFTPSGSTLRVAYSITCFPEGQERCDSAPPSDTTRSNGNFFFNAPPGFSQGPFEFPGIGVDASGRSNIATDATTGSVTLIRSGYGAGSLSASIRLLRGDANLPAVQHGEPARLRFSGGPSIELLVTDSQERRAGFQAGPNPPPNFLDPRPNFLTEIFGASYSGSGIVSDPQLAIPDPQPGTYKVQVLGTGAGSYLLTAETLAVDDTVIDSQSVSGTATQGSSDSFSFDITADGKVSVRGAAGGDTTPPTTAATLSPQANAAGWNNSNVTVTLNSTDNSGGSGVKQITYGASGVQPIASTTVNASSVPIVISTEGATTISFFAADNAGNIESSKQAVVMLDKTPPMIICGGADGVWHAADVTIACNASDVGSGLANSSDASFSLTTNVPTGTETANASTGAHSVCDVAGNCANAGPIGGNMVDKKPPTISITIPTNTSYLLNQAISANYACSDGGSGVATCTGTVASGAGIDTASVGSKTFIVNAADKVGNVSPPQSVTYTVAYNLCLLYDPTRSAQSGSTIPLKLQLCDASNSDVSSSSVVLHAVSLVQTSTNASGVILDSGNANPDNDFRFDSSLGPTGGYIFNLSTKGLTTGSYLLSFTASVDPSPHTLTFQVR